MWKCAEFEFDTKVPIVMGILNVTPDSFSDGGSYASVDDALQAARDMVEAGACIIDVGGESTRPGATEVSPDEELSRVLEVVKALASEGICVSVDTRHASTAAACIAAGAHIINDVTGFTTEEMRLLAARSNVGCVVMHMQGTPETMQEDPHYADVVAEVRDWLCAQARLLEDAGVASERICIDPGIGFGKTYKQNVELVRNYHEFVRSGYTVMCALSRKSFIGQMYKVDEATERDLPSAAEALLACELGCGVVRAHNVAMTVSGLADLRPYCLLGLGANVALVANDGEENEGKIAQLNQAIGDLCLLPDSQIIDIASFYESEPAYYEDQDTFVNTVVLLRTGIAPKELLDYLHVIENRLGRVREIENGPRTCDIDILDYQSYVCESEILTLPHPRIVERDFVVKPLLELLPHHVLANGVAVNSVPEEQRVGKANKLR